MEEVNINDLSEMRRQKKKKRNTQKFLGFVILLTIVLGLYVSKERWMPSIKHESTSFTDDEVSDGGFPVKITNTSSYKSCSFGDSFAVLTDTRFYVLSNSGDISDTRQHFYSNSILKNAGSKTLVYEQNGSSFRVDSKRNMMYEKKVDNQIYLASVSEKGYTAVVTESEQYVCELSVFDQTGVQIYYRGCSERITDVVFFKDSSGCSIISLNASEGHIVSEITSVDFETTEKGWTMSDIETCPVSAFSSESGQTVLFGDTMCGFYSSSGETIFEYSYPDKLIDASCSESGAAMIFSSSERKKTTLVLISDPDSGVKTEVTVSSSVKQVLACNDRVYLLTENSVEAYDYKGTLVKTAEINEPYRDLYKSGKYIMLTGHNKINRIEI